MLLGDYRALDDLQTYVEAMPKAATEAARIALNQVAEREGLTMIRADITRQAAFPPGYLTDDRLGITQKATNTDLAVVITGRFRATSLARFVKNPSLVRRSGVELKVKPDSPIKHIQNAFLVKLRAGASTSNDNYNLGLAIRLKPGEVLRSSTAAVELSRGLYLLYGPSVAQILPSVAETDAPAILALIEQEFYRQFFRLAK